MHGKKDPSPTLSAEKIVALLRQSYSRWNLHNRMGLIFLFTGLTFVGIILLLFAESSFYIPAIYKSLAVFGILALAALCTFRVNQNQKRLSFQQFYNRFFQKTGREGLLSAIDLYLHPEQKSSRFYDAAIIANTKSVNPDEIKSEITDYQKHSPSFQLFRNSSLFLLTSLVGILLYSTMNPDGSLRGIQFWKSFERPNPFVFEIRPGNATIEHGSEFTPQIHFNNGNYPNELTLAFKTDVEENFRFRAMNQAEKDSMFTASIELTDHIVYYMEMDGFTSDQYRVNVQQQPRFDELIATVIPPGYTGLSHQIHEYPYSDIRFYPGSEIEFEGTVNKPVSSLKITGGQTELELDVVDDSTRTFFATTLSPDQTDTLRFEITDTDGLSNQNSFRTVLSLREDEAPSVVIREPTGTVMETNPGELEIEYQASDDFGLSRTELRWELSRAFTDAPQTSSKSINTPQNGRTEIENWNLSELDLRPRDELTFRIRVWDNDGYSGAKWSESQPVIIQVPSLTDYFEDLDRRERDVDSGLENISDQFDEMEHEYEQFMERMRQNPEGGFEQEQNLEEIREQQESMDKAVREMNEQFEQIRSELENNDSISEETRRNYRELQQLMEELDDPALREAMEQLQNALESMSSDEMEEALENVQFNEELYRERLQRTVELFKRLKMNSDLDKLARQYEDMAERMDSNDDRSIQQLSDELDTMREEMDRLDEQIKGLDRNPPRRSQERLKELKEQGLRDLENLKNQTDQLNEDVSESDQNRETQPSDEIKQDQQQLHENLQAQAQNFRSSVQQMNGQQINVNILALQQVLYQLLEMSDVQEFVTETAAETRNRSQGFVDLARVQKNISDQFEITGDTLFQISSEIPGIPNQINRKKSEINRTLGQSLEQMASRNQRGSAVASREALGGLNDLASMIADLINQLLNQQGGGGGGMSMQQLTEQLQQMSGDQQQLNQRLQELINDMQGDRLTREESERMDQLARQQNEIRKQLQQLQQSGTLQGGDRTLSELQRMLEDMEDSINDMRGGVTDPIMVERQQNILSRMLSAEDALQQRDEDDEREGTRADDLNRSIPPDITLEELQQEIRSRLQDPDFTRFSERYQRLIERYFEQLRRFDNENNPPSER